MRGDLSIAARLLGSRVRKDIGDFLNVADANSIDTTNHYVDAATVLSEELARVLACIANPTERYHFQLQLIAQLPDAVEGIRAAMIAARAGTKAVPR